ncbi:hypothetical protein DIPPA_19288 [Diplonema papillatum]|nr:hypothetical protein DIPPA_19288 [Diplonema papillatum]KAJ9468610.1 hypothetical protein DIPPA_19288 [Diplonema papillatum]
MEQKGPNRVVDYQAFRDLEWRIEVPTSQMHVKTRGEPQYSLKISYTTQDGGIGSRWLTLSHEAAEALLQDIEGAQFSLNAPHTRRVARIVK